MKEKQRVFFLKRRLKKKYKQRKSPVCRPNLMFAVIEAITISTIISGLIPMIARYFLQQPDDLDKLVVFSTMMLATFVVFPSFFLFTQPGWKILRFFDKKLFCRHIPSFHPYSKQEKHMLAYNSKSKCYEYKNTF